MRRDTEVATNKLRHKMTPALAYDALSLCQNVMPIKTHRFNITPLLFVQVRRAVTDAFRRKHTYILYIWCIICIFIMFKYQFTAKQTCSAA